MSATIIYIAFAPRPAEVAPEAAPEGAGGRAFVDLSKSAQVGPRKTSKYPFPCNRDRAWKKPMNADAIRRRKKGSL